MRTWNPDGQSLAAQFLVLQEEEKQRRMKEMSPEEQAALWYHWSFWARPNQLLPPGDWRIWLIMAGRGFGKTRVGAECVRQWAKVCERVNLIGATADDARDIMVEGESGILAVCPKDERPNYVKHARKLVWPSGCISLIFTADEPERLRGKQHEKLWGDERAAWRYDESWDQAVFGLRLGKNPQAVVTTTPRPTKAIKELRNDPATIVTHGVTYDNKYNLAPGFLKDLVKKYEGTRLGRQELNAELLEDMPGALWKRDNLDKYRRTPDQVPDMKRVVVALDPAASDDPESSAETGLICAGLGTDNRGYILDDETLRAKPEGWAKAAIALYKRRQGDKVVAERNNGGDMVEATMRVVDPNIPFKTVWASRGKRIRAEPIAALYEKGLISHVGIFAKLEDQLCVWDPADTKLKSPDRLDAAVWALTELFLEEKAEGGGLATVDQWKVWKLPKPPKATDIVVSLWAQAEEENVKAGLAAWGIFTHDAKYCAVLLEVKELMAPAVMVATQLKKLVETHQPDVVVTPKTEEPWLTRYLRREGLLVKEMVYDKEVGPQAAAEVLGNSQGWRPDLPWALKAAQDFQRYPYGEREAVVHALSLGLLHLKRRGNFDLPEDEDEAVEEQQRGAIYA